LLCAQVASLEKLLVAQLTAAPGGDALALSGIGSLSLWEGGAPAAAWASLGTMRQRCDARGEELCVTYARAEDAAALMNGW
jgi:hypothetical protein